MKIFVFFIFRVFVIALIIFATIDINFKVKGVACIYYRNYR